MVGWWSSYTSPESHPGKGVKAFLPLNSPPEVPSKELLPGPPPGAWPGWTRDQVPEEPIRATCDASVALGLLPGTRHCLGKHTAPPLPCRYCSKVTSGWRAAKMGMVPAAQRERELFYSPFHLCFSLSPYLTLCWFCAMII